MFGFMKKEPSLTSALVRYLTEIDKVYMSAYSARSTRALVPYMTSNALNQVASYVHTLGGRYFGSPKFRDTEWRLIGVDGSDYIIKKTVTFDKVSVGIGLTIGVADDYSELWTVDTSQKPIKVKSINSVRGG